MLVTKDYLLHFWPSERVGTMNEERTDFVISYAGDT